MKNTNQSSYSDYFISFTNSRFGLDDLTSKASLYLSSMSCLVEGSLKKVNTYFNVYSLTFYALKRYSS